MSSWDRWVASESAAIRDASRWRSLRTVDGPGPDVVVDGGRALVSFASNDYLGLSRHPAVVAAAHDALDRSGSGAGSSRLVVGDRPAHRDLEARLAEWRAAESAVVTSTGYQANLAALSTFGAGARIVSDELNHASIIDGCRLAGAEVAIYRHGDAEHAEALVAGAPGRVLVVSDTVFSMDGDVAPIPALSAACARHGALLILDDAHAVLDVPSPDPDASCLRVGTLSKTLGSLGGYIAGRRQWVELVVNRARALIYTTALAPPCAAAAAAAIDVCRSAEGASRRATLRRRVDAVAPGHPSPIVPVVIGDEAAALDAAQALLDAGLLVPAIRPPTVAAGTSRLRVALCSEHRAGDVARLVAALGALAANRSSR